MSNKKKIAIVLNDLEQGGAETQALYLSTGLKNRGYEVIVISFGQTKGGAYQKFSDAGIQVQFTGFREKLLLPPFAHFKSYFLFLKYMYKFVRMLQRSGVAVIIPFTYAPNRIIAGCRFWVKAATFWNQRDEGRMFRGTRVERNALRRSDFLVSNSTEGKLFLQRFTDRQIHLINNGVQEVACEGTQIAGRSGEEIKIVMVANLHHYKDHGTLLRAWKLLKDSSVAGNNRLILAGRFGTTADSIRAFIQDNHLTNSVTIAGPVTDVNSLLLTCNIGIFSSVHEGLPNAILEYMAAGLPVVATRIHGAEDALGKDYPYLSGPGNAAEMASHLRFLIEHPEAAEDWGNRNRERAVTLFSISKMVDLYESHFR